VLSCGEVMESIAPEDVRAEVRRYWAILSGKLKDKLEEMYSPAAIVFTGKGKRSEPAKLIAVRRSRQSHGAGYTSRVELDSIEVQIVGPDVAIAAFTYSYHTDKIGADGAQVRLDSLLGRATQIFQRDEAGVLRIVHEHLSATVPPEVQPAAGK
jgi:ketosteroid isomerase-like protein